MSDIFITIVATFLYEHQNNKCITNFGHTELVIISGCLVRHPTKGITLMYCLEQNELHYFKIPSNILVRDED